LHAKQVAWPVASVRDIAEGTPGLLQLQGFTGVSIKLAAKLYLLTVVEPEENLDCLFTCVRLGFRGLFCLRGTGMVFGSRGMCVDNQRRAGWISGIRV
jgi:hypothetical protein